MGTFLAWAFVFMLGFTVGALVSWWFTLYWECPKRYAQENTPSDAFEVALRMPENQDLEVFYQGRWYQQARHLMPPAFQRIQRLGFRLLRWLDEAERPQYAQEAMTRQRRPSTTSTGSGTKTGLERLHEEIDELVQKKAREQGISTPIRIVATGTAVTIWVGGEKYERLTDIPDTRIQAVIQDAVREWEEEWQRRWRRRQEMGGLPPSS